MHDKLQFRPIKTAMWSLFCFCFGLVMTGAAQANELPLDEKTSKVAAWPFVRILADPSKTMTADDAIAALPTFAAPPSENETLGVRREAMWLHVPIRRSASADPHWVINIDYPPLHQVDFFIVQNGRITQKFVSGSLRDFFSRPLLARSHAIPLSLEAVERFDLLVRVETRGAAVLPMYVESPASFHRSSTFEQMIQGLLVGIALCLVFYSVAQYVNSRERLFAKYALLVSGSLGFSLLQFGIGGQFLWTNNFWIERHAAGLSALAAIAGTFLFLEEALREIPLARPTHTTTFEHLMKGGAWLCLFIGIVFASGVFDTGTMAAIVTVLGPLPTIVAAKNIIGRARRGDPIGWYLGIAFAIYMIGVIIITAVIRGNTHVNFWTLHAFQFAATLDMLAFMYVLTLRNKAIRLAVLHASREADIMRALAHSDPLTGLANRRSLSDALKSAIARCGPGNLLALYVIDLDNFKPVNDRFGHDVGDELLIQVSQRIKGNVRQGDIVSRLGGDEFVVLASGLRTEEQAATLGESLMRAFREPIALSQQKVTVSLTIGYATAPTNGMDSVTLLKLADDAMYNGKQTGKGQLRRA